MTDPDRAQSTAEHRAIVRRIRANRDVEPRPQPDRHDREERRHQITSGNRPY